MNKCKRSVFFVVALGFFLLILEVLSTPAQVKEKEPTTKLRAFIAERGKSIIPLILFNRVHFEGCELGEVAGKWGEKIKFYSLVLSDPGKESEGVRGIKIQLTWPEIDEESLITYLDFDEIENLSKRIENMVNLSNKWKGIKKKYTVVNFSTKDNFEVGFFQKKTEQIAFSFIDNEGIFFTSPQDLNLVKSLVDKGLKLLSEK